VIETYSPAHSLAIQAGQFWHADNIVCVSRHSLSVSVEYRTDYLLTCHGTAACVCTSYITTIQKLSAVIGASTTRVKTSINVPSLISCSTLE